MGSINTERFLTVIAAILSAAAGPLSAAGWWNYEWKFRCPVSIAKTGATRLGGDDIAVVTMATGGKMRPDAADIRVITSSKRELASRVLMIGPGDRVRLAFAVVPGVTKYYVYYGKADAKPSKKSLTVRRGVLLSIWEYRGGGTGTIDQMKRTIKRANVFIGRDFRDRIFLGHNPFGPQQRIASTFSAWLKCPRDGRYVFSTSSRNSSFLLVDSKVVVDNHGLHRPQRDIRKRSSVELKAGLHELTFYHVSSFGDPVAVVAWRPPGAKRITIIPPGAFAPFSRATPAATEQFGKDTVDFIAVHAGEAFMKNRYYQRFSFEGLYAGKKRKITSWLWDFGDGQTVIGPKAEHVYLRDGTYTVTLTAKVSTVVTFKRVNRIVVTRPWDRVTSHRLDSLRRYAEIVSSYNFRTLRPGLVAEAMYLFQRTGRKTAMMRAGSAFSARAEAPAAAVGKILPIYADALIADGKVAQAAEILTGGVEMTEAPSTITMLLNRAGGIYLELGKADKAMSLFRRVLKQYATLASAGAIRIAQIGVGDVWRFRGDARKARAAYELAGKGDLGRPGGVEFARGDLARHVEDYLRGDRLADAADTLDKWRQSLPMDTLDGYWSLLRAKLLMRKRKYAPAVREVHILVRVNPDSYYAAELLMTAAKAYRKMGRDDESAAELKRVVKDYPESALSAKAAEMLKR